MRGVLRFRKLTQLNNAHNTTIPDMELRDLKAGRALGRRQ
jgi:hypothetical protein